jgi:hypothetical protein
MIRNMRGTIAATSADAARVPPGQRQNSPARHGGLRSRERRFAKLGPDRATHDRPGTSR